MKKWRRRRTSSSLCASASKSISAPLSPTTQRLSYFSGALSSRSQHSASLPPSTSKCLSPMTSGPSGMGIRHLALLLITALPQPSHSVSLRLSCPPMPNDGVGSFLRALPFSSSILLFMAMATHGLACLVMFPELFLLLRCLHMH